VSLLKYRLKGDAARQKDALQHNNKKSSGLKNIYYLFSLVSEEYWRQAGNTTVFVRKE
jgi:hypothetical protein